MKYHFHTLPFTNSFASLSEDFYSRVSPTPFDTEAVLLHYNDRVADLLGLDAGVRQDPACADICSGKTIPDEAAPLAMLYAGHQFGQYVAQLGDGRAIMLGEIHHPDNGRFEIQLKGSGLTPYSRDGDGRAVLRSTIREYLCSEAMHGLGIPTTRALCIVGSDDEVYRERIEPGAILTRVAPSHVRFGSFEVFYYRGQPQHLRTLADYVISHHFSGLLDAANPYLALLETVIERTASLIAQWQAVGFCHGVMNSDNMSILGLTLDYGPFGFMEAFNPAFVCNHSDYQGRYAYNQQPDIGLFNLSCFAQAILPLLDNSPEQAAVIANDKLRRYVEIYNRHYRENMRAKFGLGTEDDSDAELMKDFMYRLGKDKADFTIAFRELSKFPSAGDVPNTMRDLFLDREAFDNWAERYQRRLQQENSIDEERHATMQRVNPKFILRNYMAEVAIRKAEDEKNYSEIDRLMTILQSPYDEHPEHEHYAGHPPDWADQLSVSCSS